ncbi:hypothetical protein Q3G72_010239 [Acer saccharum]|nr:hypothetical protein Q3G72_010239 [Acer saccharum]
MVKEEYLLYMRYSAEIQKLVYSLSIKQPMRRFLHIMIQSIQAEMHIVLDSNLLLREIEKQKPVYLFLFCLAFPWFFLVLVSSDQQFLEYTHIVELKVAYEDRHSVNLIMELCAGGELLDRIIAKGHYSERAATKLCRQMLTVVHNCHLMGVMHRDLKPENFLLLNHPWMRVDGDTSDKPLDIVVLTRMKQFRAMNKLKNVALKVIAENLCEEEIMVLKEMFKSMDTDNSGTITYVGLKAGLPKLGTRLSES